MEAEAVTRTQEVVRQIRDLILDGALGPGEQLTEVAMAQRIGVSRTPIRDALNTLATEGLLIYLPNRGYIVRRFDVQEVLDAFDTRGTLEGMACRVVAERGLSSDLERSLEDIIARSRVVLFEVPWDAKSHGGWHALNLDFHFALIDATANRHLMNAVRQLRRLPRIFDHAMQPHRTAELQALYQRDHSRVALAEHEELFGAIRAGQGTRAEFLMREHVWRNREVLRLALQADGQDSRTAA
jgi:GntR family transcriptional regulator, vanillate catabolism transcriptional regulator